MVESFEQFIADNRDEITALQLLYSQPYARRLRLGDIRTLAAMIAAPPRAWTPEKLWAAYEALDRSKVRGAGGRRLLTDMVSLVRFALHEEGELVPYAEKVEERFTNWLAGQAGRGKPFTPEQRQALDARRRARMPDRPNAPVVASPTTRLNGYVQRENGKSTVWVNGEAIAEGRHPEGIRLLPGRADPGKVTIVVDGSEQRFDLKVGQSLDRGDGAVRDVIGGGRIGVRPSRPPQR